MEVIDCVVVGFVDGGEDSIEILGVERDFVLLETGGDVGLGHVKSEISVGRRIRFDQ